MLSLASKEYHLLLACLNTKGEQDSVQKLLRDTLNWKVILESAQGLGLAPLLYFQFNKPGISTFVPQKILERLKQTLILSQVKNMRLYVKLNKVLAAFAHAGIPVIVLKGAALAELVYPQLGFRPMGDIDLLVKDEDLGKADHLLRTLHYQPYEKNHTAEWFRNSHHHLAPYVSNDHTPPIEIHFHIISPLDPVDIPIHELWNCARAVHIAEVPCFVLSPEYFLIHLCHHLSSSNGFLSQLRGLCDVAETIRWSREELDWSELLRIAQSREMQKCLYYALWLAQKTVGADVPQTVLEKLKNSFGGLPFEDRLIKFVIQRAILIHDIHKHRFYHWGLMDSCPDLLSRKGRWEKLRGISYRMFQRYTTLATGKIPQGSRFPLLYPRLVYPLYVIGKLFGLKLFGTKKVSARCD